MGAVIDLNPQSKTASSVLVIDVPASDVGATDPIDETAIVTADEFTFNFSAKIPSPEVKAELESKISHDTLFVLKQHRRKYMKNPERTLNLSPNSVTLKNRMEQNTNHYFILVRDLILADGAEFKLKNASSHSANVSVLKYGDFKLKVTYECQGSLNQKAKQGPLLFKPVQIKLGSDRQFTTANDVAIDLREYNMIWSIRNPGSNIEK